MPPAQAGSITPTSGFVFQTGIEQIGLSVITAGFIDYKGRFLVVGDNGFASEEIVQVQLDPALNIAQINAAIAAAAVARSLELNVTVPANKTFIFSFSRS